MQFNRLSFGVDAISFEDSSYNVFGVKDVTKAELNLSYEIAEKRGGTSNEIRDARVHSRNGELTIETGYCDERLATLLSGGSISSLGTSSASITTDVNSIYGGTNTIKTAFSNATVTATPALVKTERYYIEAISNSAISVTRQSDGKTINSYALTANGTIALSGEGLILLPGATGVNSLMIGEKAYLETRAQINSINNVVTFDETKPVSLKCNVTVNENGMRRQLKIAKVIPSGSVERFSATEFAIKDLKMKAIFDEDSQKIAELMTRG